MFTCILKNCLKSKDFYFIVVILFFFFLFTTPQKGVYLFVEKLSLIKLYLETYTQHSCIIKNNPQGLVLIISLHTLFIIILVLAMLLAMPSSGLEPETSPLPRGNISFKIYWQYWIYLLIITIC